MSAVFVTGSTGYIGLPLVHALLRRGHAVHALARAESLPRLPSGVVPVIGNALDASTFTASVPVGSTLVHLIGTPHPNPSKAAEFQRVDLASIRATVAAAIRTDAAHIVYVSVAHPAPAMHAYIAARREGETAVLTSGIPATILRPWYVLGPGHRWPYALVPMYALLTRLRRTRDTATRLGLVTRPQMVAALVEAVEHPPSQGVRIMDVPAIRAAHDRPAASATTHHHAHEGP